MKIIGQVKSVRDTGNITVGLWTLVEVIIESDDGELTVRMPQSRARAYQPGRRIVIHIEPAKAKP